MITSGWNRALGANGTRVSHVNLGHPCGPPSEPPSHFLGLSPFIIVTAARAPSIRKCTHSDEVQQGRFDHELKRKSKPFALYRKAKRARESHEQGGKRTRVARRGVKVKGTSQSRSNVSKPAAQNQRQGVESRRGT